MREREQSLKHIDYSNFNTVQKVEKSTTEQRYMFLQSKVAETVIFTNQKFYVNIKKHFSG